MSRTTARSREVLILFFWFVVTTPHHRCSAANMAWDPLASVGRMLTVLGFCLAVQTALTLISHVSLQVYRKPISMFTTYPLPVEVQMFSATRCLQPSRIAVERAGGYRVFVQSHGRSLRAVALAVRRWISSMVTILCWRPAFVGLSQSVMQASSLVGRLTWFQESYGQQCVKNKEHSGQFYVFSAVACLMSASASEKGFTFAVREGCRELASEVGRVSERRRFKRSSRSIRARSRALRSIAGCSFTVFNFGRG